MGSRPQRIRRIGDSLQMLTREARSEVVRYERKWFYQKMRIRPVEHA